MGNELVQAQYEQLADIVRRFVQQAERSKQLQQQVTSRVDALKNQGWTGAGSEAFYSEMDQSIFPALQRLAQALARSSEVTQQSIQILREAEGEAAAPFTGSFTGVERGAAAGNMVGAAHPVPTGGVGQQYRIFSPAPGQRRVMQPPLPSRAPSPIPAFNRDLAQINARRVFSEDGMESMIGRHFTGEDDPQLNTDMERMQTLPPPPEPELTTILNRMAAVRGIDPTRFRTDYEKFEALRSQVGSVTLVPPTKTINVGGTPMTIESNYLGSTISMRFGKVVGDVLGIDPVFGSLLSPTGGLMGPNNGLPVQPGEEYALAYHSEFHDAGGFLYNHFKIGPGYTYAPSEYGKDPGNSMAGQSSGIRFWSDRIDSPGWDFLSEDLPILGMGTVKVLHDVYKLDFGSAAKSTWNLARHAHDSAWGLGENLPVVGPAFGAGKNVQNWTLDKVEDVGSAAKSLAKKADPRSWF